jgi:dTDP-4-amino-4,6-dideoxygalactose transaminase
MSSDVIPFNKPSVAGREIAYLQEAIERGQLSGDGHFSRACSHRIAELTGATTALLTHSCTAALEMAAMLCDLSPGDEVIMPSFTYVSTANAVVLRRAVPVFVDIDPETLSIDPAQVARAVTGRTRAIFAVHYAGLPAEMDALAALAHEHGLFLVEDAAQALGANYKGRPAGSLGDMAAFSFHETKNVVSGEGGALTLMRPELVERAEIIRSNGTDRSRFLRGLVDKYTWVDIGSSYLPGELVAAFLYGQLEQADMIKARRLALYARYAQAFADLGGSGRIRTPVIPQGVDGNGHMFYLLLRDLEDRNAFIEYMRCQGIIAPSHYVPLHSSPAGRQHSRVAGDALRVTDEISARLVRLPLFSDLGERIEQVISTSLGYFHARS